jgi:uncharacterized membrane protein YeaQ/YmgE (transglycosylase-associated protein family)
VVPLLVPFSRPGVSLLSPSKLGSATGKAKPPGVAHTVFLEPPFRLCIRGENGHAVYKGVEVHWIWFIVVGAIVGGLGRLVHPGKDPMGWLLTIAIGIISMIVAAAISSGWLAFAIGVIVAAVLVMLVARFSARNAHTAAGRA